MFVAATKNIQQSVYGIWARSKINSSSSDHSTGTGFMIYPGIIVTCSHVIHQKGDIKNPVHKEFMVVRAPDIGIKAEKVTLLAENPNRDIALLRIDESRNESCVDLEPNLISPRDACGFPGVSSLWSRSTEKAISIQSDSTFPIRLHFFIHTRSGKCK